MSILIIAEHDNQALKPCNWHTLTAAQQLTGDIDILVIGYQCEAVITSAQKLKKIRQVFVADAKAYEHQLPENTAQLIADLAKNYQYVLMAATTFGKNILPRTAALLESAIVTDITKIISTDTFLRPIYAGNAFATVQNKESIQFLTIRSTAFKAETASSTSLAPIKIIDTIILNILSKFINQILTISTRPELTNARIVISGGRGLKNAENFKIIEELADLLGGAVGASRAAVDAGFAPNDYQVGQTGKVVAPDLYIAIGISGAIQHLAGMKDSKIIVAINNDPDAPIFEIADYGLVEDLFTATSELLAELKK